MRSSDVHVLCVRVCDVYTVNVQKGTTNVLFYTLDKQGQLMYNLGTVVLALHRRLLLGSLGQLVPAQASFYSLTL